MNETMDAKKAAELRKPFPANVIGKLPKSTCRACSNSTRKRCDDHAWVSRCEECKGSHSAATLHLDFVGHAATTDRLLAVDPGWTWEPLALDPATGMPGRDREGNLWIRLTVCGVTRLGVGDGRNAKECIGDAIRNAAMRFGVALDLWSKDELEQVTTGAERLRAALYPDAAGGGLGAALATQTDSGAAGARPSPGAPPDDVAASPASAPESPAEPLTKRTRGHLFALFAQKGIAEADQLPGANHILGTTYTSRSEFTETDALRLIAVLDTKPDVHQPEES